MRAHVQKLIAFRKSRRPLQEGLFVLLYARGDVYAFARVLESEVVLALVNRGEATTVELELTRIGLWDERFASPFGHEPHTAVDGRLTLSIGARESLVLSVLCRPLPKGVP